MNKNNGLTLPKMLFKSAFIHNPVLTQAIGICSIVAICFTLKISLIAAMILGVILIANEVLASLILKKLSRWMRIICYMLISTALLLPVMLVFDKSFSQLNAAMGIYLPLLAVNSLIVIRCEKYAVKNSIKHSLFDAISAGVGYGTVAVIVGAVREILAYGTLLGKDITDMPTFSGMALPFGGLIILGFLAAFQKWIIKRYFKDQRTNTFPLKTAFETPVLRERGIRITSGTFSILNDPAVTASDEKTAEKLQTEETLKEPSEENSEGKDGGDQ